MGICVPMYYLYANICDIETFKLTGKLKELCKVSVDDLFLRVCLCVSVHVYIRVSMFVCVCEKEISSSKNKSISSSQAH